MSHLSHKTCVGDRAGGEVSGRKLNILLGQDPDDNLFMDPCNQHYVCAYVKKLAQQILPSDVRLYKKVLPEKNGPIRRSRRVELLDSGRKKLDMATACNMKEVMIFC